jgi:predicted phosphoribosyltransferase
VAVPTAAPSTCEEFQALADSCVCTIRPEPFRAVGLWYDNFEQISDEEVCSLLANSAETTGGGQPPEPPGLLAAEFPKENAV